VGFYARALLRDTHAFGLRGLVDFAANEGVILRVEPSSAVDDGGWREAELWAPGAAAPVEMDVSRRDEPASLLHDEIAEFEDDLEDADERVPGGTARVREHLAATGAIVAVRVLTSDEREGSAIGNSVLDWYAQRDDVLFQVDAQGFYDGDELLVAS
jgi:hypothetical protein